MPAARLLNVLENYPRDELFQIDEDTLYRFALEIMNLSERPRIRALAAHRRVRSLRVGARLRAEGPLRHRRAPPHRRVPGRHLRGPRLGRLSGLSGRPAGPHPLHHRPRRRRDAAGPARDASKRASPRSSAPGRRACATALADGVGGPRARALAARYANAFSAAYREAFSAEQAIVDIGILEQLSDARPARRRPLPARRRRRHARQPEGLLARRRPAAVRARAAPRKSRLPRRQRAHLPRRIRRARSDATASGCTT